MKTRGFLTDMLYKYYSNVISRVFSGTEHEYNEENEVEVAHDKIEAFFTVDKTHFIFVKAKRSFDIKGTPLDDNMHWTVFPKAYRFINKGDEMLIRVDDIHRTADVQLLRFTEQDVTFRLTGPEFKGILDKIEEIKR